MSHMFRCSDWLEVNPIISLGILVDAPVNNVT